MQRKHLCQQSINNFFDPFSYIFSFAALGSLRLSSLSLQQPVLRVCRAEKVGRLHQPLQDHFLHTLFVPLLQDGIEPATLSTSDCTNTIKTKRPLAVDNGLQLSWLNKELIPAIGIGIEMKTLSPGTSLASAESLSMPLFQEVVLSADIGCSECQRRLADMMSKMGDLESVMVSTSEKKVTLICRNPRAAKVPTTPSRLVPAVYINPLNKFALFKRILRSS